MDLNQLIDELQEYITSIDDFSEKVEAINKIRKGISQVSPFQEEPTDCVLWVRQENVQANEYNPNHVASPEMTLLHTSIREDGYTMPIVTYDMRNGSREIVDGFHRNRVAREYPDIQQRVHGYLPVTTLNKPLDQRIAATIRHNRARGTHGIRPMSAIVMDLTRSGWTDERICQELGMDLDEVIRRNRLPGCRLSTTGKPADYKVLFLFFSLTNFISILQKRYTGQIASHTAYLCIHMQMDMP